MNRSWISQNFFFIPFAYQKLTRKNLGGGLAHLPPGMERVKSLCFVRNTLRSNIKSRVLLPTVQAIGITEA